MEPARILLTDDEETFLHSTAADIDTNLSGTLTASASNGAGGIFIMETDGLVVGDVDAGTGNAELGTNGGSTRSRRVAPVVAEVAIPREPLVRGHQAT